MSEIRCRRVLSAEGWRDNQRVVLSGEGRIAEISTLAPQEPADVDFLVPAPANLHSHAFQRAMAGMTERRGPAGRDSFWTWRDVMYRFVDVLTPGDVQTIAEMVQMESLEAGFGSVVEFHYLHHGSGGAPYTRLAEMAERIVEAALLTGCGLTLLPVFYEQGGCDGRPLGAGQARFGCDTARYAALFDQSTEAVKRLPADAAIGVAPHSLRAVSPAGLKEVVEIAGERPIHIHIAEQIAEVREVEAAYGARPVEWLFGNAQVDGRWCMIHATHMTEAERSSMAASGAIAGLCPLTEANLGDGAFEAAAFLQEGGAFGVGSDSNVQIDLGAELRQLEYAQRLRDRERAVLATAERSTGRRLLEDAARGGAQAAARGSGAIEVGALADLTALDGDAVDLIGKTGDDALDAWIFAGAREAVTDVWSAGRHVVSGGRHVARDAIRARYAATLKAIGGRL